MSENPQVLSYADRKPTAVDEPAERGDPTKKALNLLTWGILLICLAIWAVIGAIFWIPLMIRQMVLFSVALVPATLAGKRPDRAASLLKDAVSFYRRGFKVAIDVVARDPDPWSDDEDTGAQVKKRVTPSEVANEIAWAVLTWYVIFLVLGFTDLTPVAIWNWLVEVDWYDTFVRPLRDFLTGLMADGADGT